MPCHPTTLWQCYHLLITVRKDFPALLKEVSVLFNCYWWTMVVDIMLFSIGALKSISFTKNTEKRPLKLWICIMTRSFALFTRKLYFLLQLLFLIASFLLIFISRNCFLKHVEVRWLNRKTSLKQSLKMMLVLHLTSHKFLTSV